MHHNWESLIQEAMEEFNFSKVRKVMKFLEWEWEQDGVRYVPKKNQLKAKAENLMYETISAMGVQTEIYRATGGFVVQAWIDEVGVNLALTFEVDSWEASRRGK